MVCFRSFGQSFFQCWRRVQPEDIEKSINAHQVLLPIFFIVPIDDADLNVAVIDADIGNNQSITLYPPD